MMRPVGALIFGWLGDRFGRRIPLMVDIIFYSVMELLTAFAPNFTVFLILRALFGIGMGGEWGLGASLAMESLPTQARGLFSGILQQGYAVGCVSPFWLARTFRRRCGAGISRDLYPYPRSGIADLATRPQSTTDEAQHVDPLQTARRSLYLCRAADDRVQLHVARNPGPLRDLFAKAARV
jgi:hypothetical protein